MLPGVSPLRWVTGLCHPGASRPRGCLKGIESPRVGASGSRSACAVGVTSRKFADRLPRLAGHPPRGNSLRAAPRPCAVLAAPRQPRAVSPELRAGPVSPAQRPLASRSGSGPGSAKLCSRRIQAVSADADRRKHRLLPPAGGQLGWAKRRLGGGGGGFREPGSGCPSVRQGGEGEGTGELSFLRGRGWGFHRCPGRGT